VDGYAQDVAPATFARPLAVSIALRVDLRREQVVVEIERYRIQGALHLPAEGYRSRLSDYMNQREAEFLPMTDCQIETVETGQSRAVPFLLVARRHVRMISPVEASEDQPS
jgi:hypothetical protein